MEICIRVSRMSDFENCIRIVSLPVLPLISYITRIPITNCNRFLRSYSLSLLYLMLLSFPLFLRCLRKKAINFAKTIIKSMIFIGIFVFVGLFVAVQDSQCSCVRACLYDCMCVTVFVSRLSNGTKLKIYC